MRRLPHWAVALALALLSPLGAAPGVLAQPTGSVSDGILATAAAGAVPLSGPVTRVLLASLDGTQNLGRRLTALARDGHLFLVLGDLRAEAQPGIVYEIYLGLPSGAAADNAHFVGTLNFFAAAPPNKTPKSRSYDVTRTLSMLLSRGLPDGGLAVTIIPAAGAPAPSVAPPTIGRLSLTAQ
jgi:hypothetical protein